MEKKYVTDQNGQFTIVVPRGKEYALQSYAKGSYAFWSTLESDVFPSPAMQVELRLVEPSASHRIRLHVTGLAGTALGGAKIIPALVDDLPFMRQWPEMATDDAGIVDFFGLDPGQNVGFFLRHPSIDSGARFDAVVIPVDREVRITVSPRVPF